MGVHKLEISYVSLPTAFPGKKIIPEMLVHMCTPKLVDVNSVTYYPTPGHDNQLEGYREMRAILGTNDAPATTSGIIHQLSQTESNNDYRHPRTIP